MFEIGEKIICIDDVLVELIDGVMISNKGITLNKEYVVVKILSDDMIQIRNNANWLTRCENKLFVNKAMYRRMKIEKIRNKAYV